jgi:hypothetical protein
MSESKHTPGPWRWEVNEKGKSVQLCGGVPRYDRTVMDFVRWGMGGATPRFQDASDHGLLTKCLKWAKAVIGREHHAHWFKSLDHPDARLIAAAPELLEALEGMLQGFLVTQSLGDYPIDAPCNKAAAAIAKAKGEGV